MRHRFGALSRPPLAVLLGTASAVALGAGALGHAQPGGTAEPAGTAFGSGATASPAGSTTTITLVTGDRVTMREVPGGRHAITVDPAARANGVVPQFRITTRGDETHVVPSDVQALIPSRLDPALFDVATLAEHGLDDASSPVLPLIVDYPDDRPATLRSPEIPGTEPRITLDSLNAVAVDAERADAGELGAAVVALAAASTAGNSAERLTADDAGPLAGVDKIWLDAPVEAQLDRSTGQIGAPSAWDAGVDGTGVTVAVLDTGIDDTHPDLTGRVDAAANFTLDADATDNNGHGTHVASTVAGSGAASDGARQGVAPGARLLSGKVLDADGSGWTSWVIAGMEWAAADQDADIVNMSLGLAPGHFEAPLVTGALDRLSAENGTLFVVAAGNAGCASCIGSPGEAASALTVGAVDRDDELAVFSSRGPLHDGYGLKPDITAPGVDIAAARAAGTGNTGDPYIAYSGTSMASPHVAGAAALLAQAHPHLTGPEIKGALMSTATPNADLSVFDQGAGRVDVGQALDAAAVASPGSLDFGLIPFAEGEVEPLRQTITYRNVSDQPTTLQLTAAVDGSDAVSVEPAQLSIDPGGTASAQVTVDADAIAPGQFTGEVVAEADRAMPLRTPLGFVAEEEHFELTVRAVARDGRPARAWANGVDSPVVDVETGEQMYDECETPSEGMDLCVRVPAGTYSVMAYVHTQPAWAPGDGHPQISTPLHSALVGDPEFSVDGDATVTLDARQAVEVEVETPDHDARANLGGAADMMWMRTPESGPSTLDYLYNMPGSQLEERLFMQPSDEVTAGSFTATSRWRLEAPSITLDVEGHPQVGLDPTYYRADWFSDNSWQFPMLDGRFDLPVVAAGSGSAEDIGQADLGGALALIRRSDEVPVADAANRAAAAGAVLVAVYNDQPGPSDVAGWTAAFLDVPTVRLSGEEGTAMLDLLESGPVSVEATGTPTSPYLYDLVYAERGGISGDLHYVADTDSLAAVERSFHTQLDGSASEVAWPFQPGVDFAAARSYPLRAVQSTRTDFHIPDPDTVWEYGVTTPEEAYNGLLPKPFVTPLRLSSPAVSYAEPGLERQSWLRQPLVPGFNSDYPMARRGDVLIIPTAGYVDAAGNFAKATAVGWNGGYDGVFRVWHGDELLGEAVSPTLPSGTILLPPEDETYRITYVIDNTAPWASMSTHTETEWTFGSSRTDPDTATVVPLLTLDHDLGADLTNRMRAPRDRRGLNEVEVAVGHVGDADIAVTGLTFAVSYDDGETWDDLRVRRSRGNSFAVHLPARAPKDNTGFVSLRVGAVDAEGNRIDQEIIRAVALPE